jgi:hypothetical protein
MKRLSVLFLSLLLASAPACGGSSSGVDVATADDAELDAAGGQAREIVKEIYSSLRRGDLDGLITIISPTVVAVGPDGEVYTTREDLLVALGQPFRAGSRHKVTSRRLNVAASPSGKSASASDSLEIDGVDYRLTAVLAEVDGLWVVWAVALSRPRPAPAASAKAPAPIPGGVADGLDGVMKLFAAALVTPEARGDQWGEGKRVSWFTPTANEATRGRKAIRKQAKKSPPPALVGKGAPRALATPDGGLAWVCAGAEDSDKARHRVCATYERGPAAWQLVAWHDSW